MVPLTRTAGATGFKVFQMLRFGHSRDFQAINVQYVMSIIVTFVSHHFIFLIYIYIPYVPAAMFLSVRKTHDLNIIQALHS